MQIFTIVYDIEHQGYAYRKNVALKYLAVYWSSIRYFGFLFLPMVAASRLGPLLVYCTPRLRKNLKELVLSSMLGQF